MPTIPVTQLAHLTAASSFGNTTTDFRPKLAFRYNGTAYLTRQIINAISDDTFWNSANYPGSIHEAANYWGYYGFAGTIIRATANNLGIDGASYSNDIAAVSASTGLTARWSLKFPETVSGTVTWAWKLVNAATGAVVQSGTTATPGATVTQAISGLDAGSYLLWVWISIAKQPYTWPPLNYAAVTGQSVAPVRYQWLHPTLGVVYYDYTWNVGALPYDATKTDQANLLAQRANAVAKGTIQKNPAWAGLLTTFNNDGTPATGQGEYAMLRICAGGGSFIGDTSCHLDSTPGVPLETVGGTRIMTTPGMRSIDAFMVDNNGTLWLWGTAAGRNGREVCLLQLSGQIGGGQVTTVNRSCECALSSESASGLVQDANGTIWGLSYCELFRYQPGGLYQNRLIGSEPGGRGLVSVASGLHFLVENDFAGANKGKNYDYLLTRTDKGYNVASGTAHHVDSALCAFLGAAWGIEQDAGGLFTYTQTPTVQLANKQYLSRADGYEWERLASWPQSLADMGRVGRGGGKLLIFGQDSARAPISMVYDGVRLDARPSACEYHVWRAETSLNAAGTAESCMIVGQKPGDASWYIAETTGPTGIDFTWTPPNGLPHGGYCTLLTALSDAGISTDDLPLYLAWDAVAFLWQPSATVPSSPYLQLIIGSTTACYSLHGLLPYDPSRYPTLHWPGGPSSPFVPEPGAPYQTPTLDMCWDGASGAHGGFIMTIVALEDAGITPGDLLGYLAWNAASFAWYPTASVPSDPYLILNVGMTTVAYNLHIADLPYSEPQWTCIQVGGINPSLPWSPVPATVDYFTMQLDGAVATVLATELTGNGALLAPLMPFLYYRVDPVAFLSGSATTDELATFAPLPLAKQFNLPLPSRIAVEILYVLPSGFPMRPSAIALF